MAHWKSYTDRRWIYAFDLKGRDVNVKIARVEGGVLEGLGGRKTKKPVVYFEGVEKPLALNATNAKVISAVVGSPDVEAWIGQRITLYPTTCQAPDGTTTECIRVRPRSPEPTAKLATPDTTEQPS